MMHRLFAVTYGYLRFAFICLLGSTALFALTGLAVKSPATVAVVALVGIAAFFIVRMEMRSNQRTRELSKANEDDAKTFAQFAAYAQAADLLVSSFTEPPQVSPGAVWVCEIHHVYDVKSFPAAQSLSKIDKERIYISSALKDLESHRQELVKLGLYPLFVSGAPPGAIVAKIFHDQKPRRSTPIYVKAEKGGFQTHDHYSLSTVFAQDKDVKITVDGVQKILGDSFQLTGGEIIDLTKA